MARRRQDLPGVDLLAFAQGKANTQNLKILAPAANITVTGSTDLVRQQFDQRGAVRNFPDELARAEAFGRDIATGAH